MKEAPREFHYDRLAEALLVQWQILVTDLEYLPVGFGAHHWRVRDASGRGYFLALHELARDRDLGFSHLIQALRTAYWLRHEAELEFVLAPLTNRLGEVVHRFAPDSGLAVYPWVECRVRCAVDTRDVGGLLARVHASTREVPAGLVRAEDFALPWRRELEDALANLDQHWDTGPYGEPAREQLVRAAQAVQDLLAYYDRLAAEAQGFRPDWVITHGEPSGPNLVETDDGRTILVDWDSALLAPPERDLWEVPAGSAAFQAYAKAMGVSPTPSRLRLYRAWYHLAETAIYVQQFRQLHRGDLNDATAWENFLFHLPSYSNWPELEHPRS